MRERLEVQGFGGSFEGFCSLNIPKYEKGSEVTVFPTKGLYKGSQDLWNNCQQNSSGFLYIILKLYCIDTKTRTFDPR